jgi:hypothetical protein
MWILAAILITGEHYTAHPMSWIVRVWFFLELLANLFDFFVAASAMQVQKSPLLPPVFRSNPQN